MQNQIQTVYDEAHKKYDKIYLIANSIGTYFAMHTLQACDIEKALFISPVLDMERLILDMMSMANVSEKDLCEKGEIPTEVLYAGNDNLVSRQTVSEFTGNHNAYLTVMENGEHWFHTEEQLAFLNAWMKKVIG